MYRCADEEMWREIEFEERNVHRLTEKRFGTENYNVHIHKLKQIRTSFKDETVRNRNIQMSYQSKRSIIQRAQTNTMIKQTGLKRTHHHEESNHNYLCDCAMYYDESDLVRYRFIHRRQFKL